VMLTRGASGRRRWWRVRLREGWGVDVDIAGVVDRLGLWYGWVECQGVVEGSLVFMF